MRYVSGFLSCFARWVAVLSMFTLPVSAQDSYPIGPGDVIDVSFISNANFNRRLTVGLDGIIYVPLIGEVSVQGQSINMLREQIPLLMTGAVIRERRDGEYFLVTVEPDEVIIDIAEYRPIFVDGAVISPGRQPFFVGMSARQAIAAAQGVLDNDVIGLNREPVRNHPRVLMAELVGVLAEMAVHDAVLSGSETIDFSQIEALNVPEDLRLDAIELARSQVETSTEILNEELSFLDTSVLESETRVIASLRHEESMTAIVQTEEAEVDRVANLVARRIVSDELLTQTRRLYLQAVERLGNVQTDRLIAEADRRELVLERNQTMRERALQMQARLQELSQQAAQLRVQIELSSATPITLDPGKTSPSAPRIVIFRHAGGQAQEIEAAPETPLFPGDVVNVSIRN